LKKLKRIINSIPSWEDQKSSPPGRIKKVPLLGGSKKFPSWEDQKSSPPGRIKKVPLLGGDRGGYIKNTKKKIKNPLL